MPLHDMIKLPYLNSYTVPRDGDRVWVYFIYNKLKGKRTSFKSLSGVRLYPDTDSLPVGFIDEYLEKVSSITAERLRQIDSGVFQKLSTGVLEMAVRAGLSKREIIRLIDENLKD